MLNRRFLFVCLAFAGFLSAQVTTSQYNNARTGATLSEKALTPKNVNVSGFGELFTLSVAGDVYAQPLYLPRVAIPGQGEHDILFVATERDIVYAFDAGGKPATPLWKVSFVDPARGVSPVPAQSVQCPFISPEVGITSTPVIDPQSGTLYVLARTAEIDGNGTRRFWQRLHALSLLTGEEKLGGPVVIGASVKKAGDFGFFSGTAAFGALRENPRASLTLANGKVYLTWASSCDVGPYHGWVLAFDAHTLKQVGVLNTSPDASQSGIWQSDTGPAVDDSGNLFVSTGNGKFDATSGGHDYGDTLLKIATSAGELSVADYFTPSEQAELNSTDDDLGSGGPLLIPDQPGSHTHLAVVGGKGAVIYVVNRDHMGKFLPGANPHAIQTIKVGGDIMGAPAYWNGHIFYFPSGDVLKDFAVQNGRLSNEPVARGKNEIVDPGATPSISANGTENGIVWVLETKGWRSSDRPAVLTAYEARNVANELYNSEQNPVRDRAGIARRFVVPVVANGHVYVAASGEVDVYGLLAPPKSPKRATKGSTHQHLITMPVGSQARLFSRYIHWAPIQKFCVKMWGRRRSSMRFSIRPLLLPIASLCCFTMPLAAEVVSGTLSGDSTLTPTGTPGVFIQAFMGTGTDASLGSFSVKTMSTADFSSPPAITINGGMFIETFADGTLFGTSSGDGTASGLGTAATEIDLVFTGGTGIFAGLRGEATFTGTITQNSPTSESLNGTYVGTLSPFPEASGLPVLALGLLMGVASRLRRRRVS